jgi:hypothetical protein
VRSEVDRNRKPPYTPIYVRIQLFTAEYSVLWLSKIPNIIDKTGGVVDLSLPAKKHHWACTNGSVYRK